MKAETFRSTYTATVALRAININSGMPAIETASINEIKGESISLEINSIK
jgi:hypothetical protein